MKYFELVVPNTTPENFAKDLGSDILSLPPAEITLGEGKNLESVEIDSNNTKILPPDKDFPFFRLEIHAFTLRVTSQTKSFPQMRAVLGFGRQLGAVIRVEMREMTTTQIRVIGNCEDFVAWYMSTWISHIIDVYQARFINPVAVLPEQVVYPATPKWLDEETSEEVKQNAKEVIDFEEALKRFRISPIIERFGTWVVSTYGIECLTRHYYLDFDKINDRHTNWLDHMREKKWGNLDDFANAYFYAIHLLDKRKHFLKGEEPLKVFLSYAKEDSKFVFNIYNKLLVRGVQPWLDEKSILPGQDWAYEIKKSVKDSDVVIVFLSNKSVDKTGYFQKEIKLAVDAADERPEGKIFLIPAKVEECKVPDKLSNLQWVDLQNDDGFERLLEALHFHAQN